MPLLILNSNPVRILLLNSGELLVKSENLKTWNRHISRYRYLNLAHGRSGAHIYEFENEKYAEGADKGFYVLGSPISLLLNGNAGQRNLVELSSEEVSNVLKALEDADALAGDKVIQDNPV